MLFNRFINKNKHIQLEYTNRGVILLHSSNIEQVAIFGKEIVFVTQSCSLNFKYAYLFWDVVCVFIVAQQNKDCKALLSTQLFNGYKTQTITLVKEMEKKQKSIFQYLNV